MTQWRKLFKPIVECSNEKLITFQPPFPILSLAVFRASGQLTEVLEAASCYTIQRNSLFRNFSSTVTEVIEG